jgi:hypothetical protein
MEAAMGKSVSSSVNPCLHGQLEGTTSLENAAAICGLEPKRLLGRIWRNSVQFNDPRGCPFCGDVYVDSLPRPADHSSGGAA